jgi:copper oxidase (laccase) domain-containing protein
VRGIAGRLVAALVGEAGARADRLRAAIGPSIGPCCYEVGPEVVEQVRAVFGPADDLIRPAQNGNGPHFDLWTANARALREAGVEQIEAGDICTACNTHEFYSHRAERGKTGRFGALIVLRA